MLSRRHKPKVQLRSEYLREATILTFKYIILRCFLAVTARLPLRMLHRLGAGWGNLLYWIPNRSRRTTQRNLQSCFPDKTASELAVLTRSSLQSTACTALEMGKSWLVPLADTLALVRETEGTEAFEKAIATGHGVILLAPHLSNWEVFGFYVSNKLPTVFLYQPPKLPALDNLLKQTRSRGGIKLAPTNRQGVAQLLKSLYQGELVGVLPDQVPVDGGGLFAPFFGQQALTMTLVGKLLARKKVPVFCGFAERLPRGEGFRVIILEADAQIYSDDLQESVQGLNRSVEACVLRSLPQYQWEYKRFRRQPDGSKFYS